MSTNEKNQDEKLISIALDIGEAMLRTGGEVTRVEDTISRILSVYQFKKTNVFAVTSMIEVTAVTCGGATLTQTRRVNAYATDLEKLDKLNTLSREICADPPPPGNIGSRLDDILAEKEEHPFISYAGSIMAASGFTVFFGGNLYDAAATAVLACVINFMNRKGIYKKDNQLLYYLACSVVTGMLGNLLVMAGFGMHLDKILIGCIMLTIPGIAITYAVRDMLVGEIITGLLRFAESLLIAASIAGGYIFSSLIIVGFL